MNLTTDNVKQEVVEAFIDGTQQAQTDWEQVVDYRTSDVAALRLAPYHAIGRIPQWMGGDRPQTAVKALTPQVLNYKKFALQVRIDKFDLKDLPQVASDVAGRFGVAVPTTYGLEVADVFANAFTTATTSIDGLSLCNTAHTTKIAGLTRSNRLSTALDRTSFMAAIALYRQWRDYEGLSYDVVAQGGGFVLVVPPALEEVAKEIVGSALSGSQNQVNVAGSFNTTVVVWSLLSDANDWFLCSRRELPIKFWERASPDLVVNLTDDDSGELKMNLDFAITAQAGPTPDGIVGASVA
jgi:phage major head subunit gpT-like protein